MTPSRGHRVMTGRIASGILVLITCLSLGGCAAHERQSRATQGAVSATAAGAATGSAIGAIDGGGEGAWNGVAIGAVGGGLSGDAIGRYMDNQARDMQEVLAEQDRLRREQETLQVALSSDVMFDSGTAYLQPGARDKLDQVADVLNRYSSTDVAIVGHTDSRGSKESNYELSRRRARAIADVLIADGVGASRISMRGEGESRPVATNATAEGRAQNRRVEISISPSSALQAEQSGGARAPAAYEEPR
jgi:outer membrane protein OmpA-like peptidoglycan-associated protein